MPIVQISYFCVFFEETVEKVEYKQGQCYSHYRKVLQIKGVNDMMIGDFLVGIDWKLLLFICFCINATLAINYSIRFAIERKPNMQMNYLVSCVTISSAIWSVGMGLMSIQVDAEDAVPFRMVGMFGCFMFMMSVQKIMCLISEINHTTQIILNGLSYTGIFVYLVYATSGQTTFVINDVGLSFYFKPGIVTWVYAVYFTLVSANIFLVTIHMLRHHRLQRVRAVAKRFILVELLVFMGAVFDMVLPVLGKPALPGSAITHFWGVVVFWYAIHGMFRAQITITNMSEYIYYSLDIPVLVLDTEKRVQISNDAAKEFLELDKESKANKLEQLFELQEDFYAFSGKSNSVESYCKVNGVRCQIAISKIQDDYEDVVGFILLISDLRERDMVIEQLKEAKLEADAANQSKSLFLANMSHEIRTPMNAIIGFAELALKDDIDETAKGYVQDIRHSGQTLLALINDVLSISKIELGKHELNCGNYKPANLFNDVNSMIGVQAKAKNLLLEVKIDENYPEELYGDVDKIREILINLLNNSVKYTKSGRVKLEISVSNRTEDEIETTIRVSDTGIGIKPEDINSIFDKFQRMDAQINRQTEGTGLGLSITKGLVELMKGSIEVESVYGIGSVFTVKLPQRIVDETPIRLTEAEEEEQEHKHKELHFKEVSFLAVDDNAINRKVISKIMERYGINYELAESGQEAISLCQDKTYDVIFMDQMMPVMDGVEAMHLIRKLPAYENNTESKIIALTANVIEGVKEELLEEGFDSFLGKPIDFKEFESVLCAALPESKYYFE